MADNWPKSVWLTAADASWRTSKISDGMTGVEQLRYVHIDSLLRRVLSVIESVKRDCPSVGVACDVWEHDVDCACLEDTIRELLEGELCQPN